MLWLDLIDIVYLLIGFSLGFIICAGVSKDALQDECDECDECEYRQFIEEVMDRAER